jgi:4-hydroxyproline epimerase
MQPAAKHIDVIDSHTGGEPTRVVIAGGPELAGNTLAERRESFRAGHDAFRSAVINEPRGSDVLVGGLLCEPVDPGCAAGVIFFNNVGYLNMCGHGIIGLIVTLAHMGRIGPGEHRIETPVGVVTTWLHETGHVTFRNVASFRHRRNVQIAVPEYGTVTGDIAWGGNWFFLVKEHDQQVTPARIEALTHYTWAIRRALEEQNITGAEGGRIDHIELFGPPSRPELDSRNFVLCPGKAYDRSPCGTGTSAKLACLFADGKLAEGEIWRQESIVGSVFEGSVEVRDAKLYPRIRGSAFITAEARLILASDDPFRSGIRL